MKYIPALRYHFLTPFYDRFIRFFIPEKRIKENVIAISDFSKNDSVLDFGCGTGTLCRMIKQSCPKVKLTGIDTDLKILEIAEKKKPGDFQLIYYDGEKLPFEDACFDKIIATWVFHHFTNEQKIQALKEIKRILKPNGKLVIADWGKPRGILQKILFFIVQLLDNFKTFKIHRQGGFPRMIESYGFPNLKELGREKTLFGTLYYWVGKK